MQKSPNSQNHREANNEKSKFGLKSRLLVTFILGLVAGGIVVSKCSDADQPKRPGITDTSGGQSEGGDGPPDDDKPWPSNRVPLDKFDEAPEEYVDVDQCRELIFRVTGHRVAIGLEEIDEQCKELAKKRGEAAAEKIINDFCISNPEDMNAIYNAALKGYTKFESLRDVGRGYWLWLRNNENLDSDAVWLKEKPPCRPPITTEEEELKKEDKEEEQRLKESIELARQGKWSQITDNLDFERAREAAKKADIDYEVEKYLKEVEAVVKKTKGKMTAFEMIKSACRIHAARHNMVRDIGWEKWGDIDKGDLSEFLETVYLLSRTMLETNGIDDPHECQGYYQDFAESESR